MRIVTRAQAKIDPVDIRSVSDDHRGRTRANALIDENENAIKTLIEFPRTGAEFGHIDRGLRRLVVAQHLVFYRIHEDWIEFARVLHERMDARSHLDQ